ncbi:hypothetical protein D3C86_2003110 [compost metagenome]
MFHRKVNLLFFILVVAQFADNRACDLHCKRIGNGCTGIEKYPALRVNRSTHQVE